MSHLCKLRHREKSSKIFEDSFLKNGILESWSEAVNVSFLSYSSNENSVNDQDMIFTKCVITNNREKSRKL